MFDKIIKDLTDKNEKLFSHKVNECDYQNAEGLLMCGKCNTPKQKKLPNPFNKVVHIPCKCVEEQIKANEQELEKIKKKQEISARLKRLQDRGITDERYRRCIFKVDDKKNLEVSEKCKAYVKEWELMNKTNTGIIFYGGVGTGKSFMACCIANALTEKGVSVLVTNLSKLVQAQVQDNPINLNSFDLLVIDDLGTENATQTAYNIIDDWYKSQKPIIVTTNLDINTDLMSAEDINRQRLFDRILQMCPLRFLVSGDSRRNEIAREKKKIIDEIFGN